MKIIVDFENGMVLTTTPDNLIINDIGKKDGTFAIAVGFKTDVAQVPFLFFENQALATPAELKQRADKLAAAIKAAVAAKTAADEKAKADAAAVVPAPAGLEPATPAPAPTSEIAPQP